LISQHLSNLGAGSWQIDMHEPKLSDFLLDLHQSLAHQGLAKSLDISIGMPLSGEKTGKVLSNTLKQVRALRIIRIIAQGKI